MFYHKTFCVWLLIISVNTQAEICPAVSPSWTYKTIESHDKTLEGGEFGVYVENGIVVASRAQYFGESFRSEETTFFDREKGDCVTATDHGYNMPTGTEFMGETKHVVSREFMEYKFRKREKKPKIIGYAGPSEQVTKRAKAILRKGYEIRAKLGN